LGTLTGSSGAISNNLGFIRFTNPNEDVLQAFKSTGEALLRKDNPKIQANEGYVKNNRNKSIEFFSKNHTNALGDFQTSEKKNTIKEKHPWVLSQRFRDKFLSGVFDSGGRIVVTPSRRYIEFATTSHEIATFYMEMLVKIG
jgi:hypothetical protein